MHDVEHDQTKQPTDTHAVEQAEVHGAASTTKFNAGGAKPAVHGGFADRPETASDRAYVVSDIATARERGDEELVIQIVKRVLDLARNSEPHIAAQLIEQLYATGVDLQYPAVAYAIRDTLAVVQQKQTHVAGASGVAHGAATAVTGTTNAGASKQQAQPQSQGQQDAGATHTAPEQHATGDGGTDHATTTQPQPQHAGTQQAQTGGNHLVGGNTPHTGPVEEGMLIDGWRVFATTARKGGTIAWKDNNPGNITVTHPNDGGMFGDYKWTDGYYRVFPTFELGRAAIAKYWRAWAARRKGMTIEDMVMQYGDSGADAREIYRSKWTHATGAAKETKIDDLTDDQLEAITKVTVAQEGTVQGTEKLRTDPSLPDGVYTGTR